MNFNDVPTMMDEVFGILAERFGSSVERLWEIALRQAYVEAGVMLFWLIVTPIVTIFWGRSLMRNVSEWGKNEAVDVVKTVASIVVGFALMIAWIGILLTMGDLFTALFNPEYYVLQQIFQLLGGGPTQ